MGLRQGEKERSIQNAYIQMIAESKHFIYIENQFFVSGTAGKPVQNCIADALAKRLERAIEEDNKRRERGDPCDHPCFKLLICLPLLPGFEGEITSKAGNVMRLQLGWLLHTLARNDSKKNSTPDKKKKKKNKDSDLNKKEEEGHFKANESIIQT
jgi:phospholipase D1/2